MTKPFQEIKVCSKEGYDVRLFFSEDLSGDKVEYDSLLIEIDLSDVTALKSYREHEIKLDDEFDFKMAGMKFERDPDKQLKDDSNTAEHLVKVDAAFEKASRIIQHLKTFLGERYNVVIDSPEDIERTKKQFLDTNIYSNNVMDPVYVNASLNRKGDKDLGRVVDKKIYLPTGLEEDLKQAVIKAFKSEGLEPVIQQGSSIGIRAVLESYRGQPLTTDVIDEICDRLEGKGSAHGKH